MKHIHNKILNISTEKGNHLCPDDENCLFLLNFESTVYALYDCTPRSILVNYSIFPRICCLVLRKINYFMSDWIYEFVGPIVCILQVAGILLYLHLPTGSGLLLWRPQGSQNEDATSSNNNLDYGILSLFFFLIITTNGNLFLVILKNIIAQ
jgi:hypothetical protein